MKTRNITHLLAGALLLTTVTACGPGDEEEETYEVSSEELSGTIGGESFAFVSGYAEDKFGDGEYWIELHSQEVEDPCDPFAYDSAPHIIISTTPETKDLNLSLSNNITFAYPDGGSSQNDIATTGRLIIDKAGDKEFEGGLYAVMDENEVDGQFTVPVCASDEE